MATKKRTAKNTESVSTKSGSDDKFEKLENRIKSLNNQKNRAKSNLEKKTKELEQTTEKLNAIAAELEQEKMKAEHAVSPLEYVSKEQLQNETLIERLRWWYYDLNSWQKVLSHVIVAALVIISAYGGKSIVEYGLEYPDGAVVEWVVALVMGLLGIGAQAKSLTTPNSKK